MVHQNGTIVRIKLRNFLTYEATEFYPGAHMNMVIGPNGKALLALTETRNGKVDCGLRHCSWISGQARCFRQTERITGIH